MIEIPLGEVIASMLTAFSVGEPFLDWEEIDDPIDPEGDPAVRLTSMFLFDHQPMTVTIRWERTLLIEAGDKVTEVELADPFLYWSGRWASA